MKCSAFIHERVAARSAGRGWQCPATGDTRFLLTPFHPTLPNMQSRSVRQEMGTTVAQQKVHSGTRDVARRLLSHLGMPAEALHAADAIQLEGSKDGPHMPSPFWVTEALAGANLAIAAMLHLIARQRMIDSSLSADAIKVNSEHATNMSHAHFTHEHGGRRYFQAQEVLQSQAGDSAGKDPNLVFNTMFVGHWICKDGRACIFYANVAEWVSDETDRACEVGTCAGRPELPSRGLGADWIRPLPREAHSSLHEARFHMRAAHSSRNQREILHSSKQSERLDLRSAHSFLLAKRVIHLRFARVFSRATASAIPDLEF